MVLRPFDSLTALVVLVGAAAIVSGLGDLLSAENDALPRVSVALGVGWIILGVSALVWPDVTVTGLALVGGSGLIVAGGARVVQAVSTAGDARIAIGMRGLATGIFGLLAVLWPDVTILVIAVLFGARTTGFGLTLVGRGWSTSSEVRGAERRRRPRQTVTAALSLLVALILLGTSALLHRGTPAPDSFFDSPATVPDAPGTLLRSEEFTRAIPPNVQAWRVLYTTTTENGRPTLASALIVEPRRPSPRPRPVIAWAHGTTGFATGCAPSLLPDPFVAGALPGLDAIIDRG